jgi:hypothetical protein
MSVDLVPATLAHLREIARTMRAEDRDEVESAGFTVRHLLHSLYQDSTLRRAALVDGELAAVWGLQGVMASDVGYPWLFTSAVVERVPFAYFRVARAEIERMLVTKRTLISHCTASYLRSARTFQMLGFTLGVPDEFGPRGCLYRSLTMTREA